MRDVAIGAETTEGIGPSKTEHIDHRVEALRLERGVLPASQLGMPDVIRGTRLPRRT
jgi:hypothetical protein